MPRPAGMTIASRCWRWAICPSDAALTPCSQTARAERADEDESEDREQEANAPVGLLVGGAHYFFVRSTYP